jgi:hypothetical protein
LIHFDYAIIIFIISFSALMRDPLAAALRHADATRRYVYYVFMMLIR